MSEIDLTDLLERITGCINNAEYDDEQETLTDAFAVIEAQAAEIEQLEREKAVVSDLWEQQKEITLDYLADCNKAADRIEAQAAEIVKLREALRDIQIEAERERGNWTHLKQVIARKARAALGETE